MRALDHQVILLSTRPTTQTSSLHFKELHAAIFALYVFQPLKPINAGLLSPRLPLLLPDSTAWPIHRHARVSSSQLA